MDFVNLVLTAQARRMAGESQIAAVRTACIEHGISDEWAAPVQAFINDSPSFADLWCERVMNNALKRMNARLNQPIPSTSETESNHNDKPNQPHS